MDPNDYRNGYTQADIYAWKREQGLRTRPPLGTEVDSSAGWAWYGFPDGSEAVRNPHGEVIVLD